MGKVKRSWMAMVMGALLLGALVGVVWARPHDRPETQDITRKVTLTGADFIPSDESADWSNSGDYAYCNIGSCIYTAPVVFPCLPSVTVERIKLHVCDTNGGAAATASFHLLMVTDRELNLHYANEPAQELFGSIPDGATIIGYTRNLDLEQLAREAVESGVSEGLECDISFEGRRYRARAVLLDQGVGLALTDVSEVQRLSRARQDMVANLSHELRTPLTSLRLLTDTLHSPTGQDPKIASDLLSKMADEIDTLEQIAGEMLDLAAIESGRQVVRLVPVPLIEVVTEPVARLADQAERGSVDLVVDIPPQVQVLADKDQAGRAIQNILHNAVIPVRRVMRINLEHVYRGQH